MEAPLLTKSSYALDELEEMSTEEHFKDHSASGTYVCGYCKSPLFFSKDKFTSNKRQPTFRVVKPEAVQYFEELSLGVPRPAFSCTVCSLPLGFTFTDKGRCYAPLSVCLRFEEGQKGPVGNASVVPTKVTETKPTPAALQPAVEPEPTKDTVFKNPRVSLDHTTHNTGRTTTIELATFALHVLWLPLPIVLAYLNK
eukprot:TRINITY_DN1893_c0_g1_i1.p1 TRINITY_DN1893_c0_g1~~TRINITY_DN1893_c0_g1_i1.p1  ORF type:complete len:197 (+),score=27.78 TRINITY_DN1893_c0_g1_i1:43-633(+)